LWDSIDSGIVARSTLIVGKGSFYTTVFPIKP
jgi:hypothetical protein